tara:strand:+ start:215 stop:844 length:630 start_codon:yes stop_codon:yes gene_type:complete
MSNIAFIHIATIGNYQSIVDEIFSYIPNNGFDDILVNIAGSGDIKLPSNTKILGQRSDLNDFEFSTLNYIKDYCKNNKESNICYLHTKGASTGNNICIDEWRQYMLYFNLKNISNIKKLLIKNDTCGVDLVNDPTTHYSGNFWWSTAEHINSLPSPKDIEVVISERHKCEFWICSKNGGKYSSLHDSGINVYQRHLNRYPKEKYENSNN